MSSTALSAIRKGQVVVTGSVAFDHIMDFPGSFKDHILPDKLHVINISFLVEKLEKQRGGCAANIAYSMALLGERPRVVAAVGNDFSDYYRFLAGRGIDVEGISMWGDEMTASCFITTDKDDCQITGFYVGAMKRAREISLAETAGEAATAALVAPDDPEAMLRHCDEARQSGLPFLFDPSFQVTAMDGDALRRASEGATALFLNDYEFSVLQEKTGLTAEALRRRHPLLAVTLGEKGSELLLSDGETLAVPAAKVSEVVDPTGAGDAFRGGFAAGLMQGYDLTTCGRMGSIAAAYAIECYGTQNHEYSRQQFEERYREAFGQPLPER